ncbi:MAG: hypothetical protein RR998_09360 [Oscillospiraceae bacterium]
MMKVKYSGSDMGATEPQNHGVHEVKKIYANWKWTLLLIDESADDEAYKYSATTPKLNGVPGVTYAGRHFFIVEYENGQLAKTGLSPVNG